jgi:hypothetical protein
MIANPQFGALKKEAWDDLRESLRILDQCGITDNAEDSCEVIAAPLSAELRKELLTAARNELRACQRQLTLWRLIWATFWHRDERAIRKHYWRLRERQRFHDGVRVAELLVAVRQSLNDQECDRTGRDCRPARKVRNRPERAMHITAVIAGDITAIEELMEPKALDVPKGGGKKWHPGADGRKTEKASLDAAESGGKKWHPSAKAGKTRWLPWQRRTPSWQAAYNAACLYAALECSDKYQQNKMALLALRCLDRVVNDRLCEMERPWDWISTDPDLRCLEKKSEKFCEFLDGQKQKDYPRANAEPDRHRHLNTAVTGCDVNGGASWHPAGCPGRAGSGAASPGAGDGTLMRWRRGGSVISTLMTSTRPCDCGTARRRVLVSRSPGEWFHAGSSSGQSMARPTWSSALNSASLGWMSSTRSPAATSCWASRCPSPVAPPAAQVRSGQARAHAQQLPGLVRAGTDPHPAQRHLTSIDRHRGVRALVRVDPDHHRRHQHTPPRHPSRQWGPRRACLTPELLGVRSFSGPHRGKTRQAGTSFVSQTTPGGRQAVRDYRAEGLPGRRRIRRAPRRRAPRNTTMPMNNKYSRPLATTPTMPSTIATITSSRKRAISRSPLSRAAQRRASRRSPPAPGWYVRP